MIKIAILNQTSALSDEAVAPVLAAVQIQVSQHLAPVWGKDAVLVPVKKGERPPKGAWQVALLDTSDAGAYLGFHDATAEGLPLAKCFVKSDIQAGRPWSVTLSHEVVEQIVDPDISTVIEYAISTKSVFYALEIADPPQDNRYAYKIGSVLVSDFVFPGWFHKYRNYKTFDFAGHIKQPMQVLPGGYISIYDPTSGQGWREINAKGEPPADFLARARVGSRRERRRLPRSQWQKSELKDKESL